jgi:hypothetical protein
VNARRTALLVLGVCAVTAVVVVAGAVVYWRLLGPGCEHRSRRDLAAMKSILGPTLQRDRSAAVSETDGCDSGDVSSIHVDLDSRLDPAAVLVRPAGAADMARSRLRAFGRGRGAAAGFVIVRGGRTFEVVAYYDDVEGAVVVEAGPR